MSDTMLLGILRMPFDLALSTPIAQIQYYQRGVQAADEIEKLRAEVERLQKRDAEWTEKAAAWLSSAEAAQRLDGYRELAARVNELTLQRDEAVTLLAEWCHAVDGGASWDYWDNHYKQARWGKGILRSLIDAEIAKLEGESNA